MRDRVKILDRKVLPGIAKLKWNTDRHTLDFYFKEAIKQCKESLTLVQSFKVRLLVIHFIQCLPQEANDEIDSQCKLIASTSLVSIQQKRVYSIVEFEDKQKVHLAEIKEVCSRASAQIKEAMDRIYTFFEKDSDEVQLEWTRFTQRVDSKVEGSLKSTVKRSLQEISKCLNGEKRKEVSSNWINPWSCWICAS